MRFARPHCPPRHSPSAVVACAATPQMRRRPAPETGRTTTRRREPRPASLSGRERPRAARRTGPRPNTPARQSKVELVERHPWMRSCARGGAFGKSLRDTKSAAARSSISAAVAAYFANFMWRRFRLFRLQKICARQIGWRGSHVRADGRNRKAERGDLDTGTAVFGRVKDFGAAEAERVLHALACGLVA